MISNMRWFFKFLIAVLSLYLCSCKADDNPAPGDIDLSSFNLDFEVRNPNNLSLPSFWYTGGDGFMINLDDVEKHHGKLSLKMERVGDRNGKFGQFYNGLVQIEDFRGKTVEFRGWIKTKGVKNGTVGLFVTVYGENSVVLGYDNMYYSRLTGDNDWTQVSVKVIIPNNAKTFYFGGSFPGEGIVWFDDLKIVINPAFKNALSQDEISLLRKYVYPLRTFEPDGGDTKDLKILDNLIGTSKVVGLGENSHGSSEIFKLKNRLIQYLAVNNSFDIFSVEACMPESYKVNDYITKGEGDPKKLISNMYFWTVRTEEMLNMVEWMRRFNQPTPRIWYTGFDMQYYKGAINELFGAYQGDLEMETKIAELKKKVDEDSGIIQIEPLLLFIQNCVETATFPPSQKAWLQQMIQIIRQVVLFWAEVDGKTGNSTLFRDKFMAENVMWIKEQNPSSKLILWAHNMHIMRAGTLLMGNHLAKELNNDYVSFGFTFFEGSFYANGSRAHGSYDAITAYPGTMEYLLNQLNEPIFILDLKKIKSDNHKDTQWLNDYLTYRDEDELGDRKASHFIYRKIVNDFDYLIFIKKSTPSAVFPPPP